MLALVLLYRGRWGINTWVRGGESTTELTEGTEAWVREEFTWMDHPSPRLRHGRQDVQDGTYVLETADERR